MTTTEMPPIARLERGACSVCGRDVALRKDGEVREHSQNGAKCPGSGQLAAVDLKAEAAAARADEAAAVDYERPAKVAAAVAKATKTAKTPKLKVTTKAAAAAAAVMAPAFEQIPLELIDPSPNNVRTDMGDLTEMAASIASLGMVEPIIAVPTADGRFDIVAGERRYRASALAGVATAPVIVRTDLTEAERSELMLVENLHRKDLAPLEEADGYRQLIEGCGYTQAGLAKRISVSQSHISKRLLLLKVDPEVAAQVGKTVNVKDAEALAALPKARQRDALESARQRGGIDTEELARAVRREAADAERDRRVKKAYRDLEEADVVAVAYPQFGQWNRADDGPRPLAWLHIETADHAKCKGHAAAVSPTGEIVYVCTKPDTHRPDPSAVQPGDEAAAARRAEAEAKEAERLAAEAAFTEATEARTVVMEAMLGEERPLARPALLEHIAAALIDTEDEDYTFGAGTIALALLGIEAPEEGIPEGLSEWGYLATLAATEHGTVRLALALALGAGDIELRRPANWAGQLERHGYAPNTRRHLELLIDRGYQPASWEGKYLALGDATAAEDGRAPCARCGEAHADGYRADQLEGLDSDAALRCPSIDGAENDLG